MKADTFQMGGLWVQRSRHREGPPLVFTCCYKGSSWSVTDPKSLLKCLRISTKTPTGDALREWLAEPVPVDKQKDPTIETKMIT